MLYTLPNTSNVYIGKGPNAKINQHTEASGKEEGCRYLTPGGGAPIFPLLLEKQSFFLKKNIEKGNSSLKTNNSVQ